MLEVSGRRILITQAQLETFGGSEIVTRELAEYFRAKGAAEIFVATAHSGEPMKSELVNIPGVRLVGLQDPEFESEMAESPPELAWIHHQFVPEPLLRDPSRTRFVFNHMSSIHPLEFPFSPVVEAALADVSLFVSAEIRDRQATSELHHGFEKHRMGIFNNPAPAAYRRTIAAQPASERPRILVVTNHLVEEVEGAIELLRPRFSVDVIGGQVSKGARPTLVTPELIHTAEAVIAIGKTVQYALVAGVPVFCYDVFGGPGWLSSTNFDRAAHGHFCGRGFTQRSAATIAAEIIGGFESARLDAAALRDAHCAEFTLETRLSTLFGEMDPRPSATKRLSGLAIAQHLKTQETIVHYLRSAKRAERAAAMLRDGSQERIAALRSENDRLRELRESERARARRAEDAARDLREAREHERARARRAEEAAKQLAERREHERDRARRAEKAAEDLRTELAALKRSTR